MLSCKFRFRVKLIKSCWAFQPLRSHLLFRFGVFHLAFAGPLNFDFWFLQKWTIVCVHFISFFFFKWKMDFIFRFNHFIWKRVRVLFLFDQLHELLKENCVWFATVRCVCVIFFLLLFMQNMFFNCDIFWFGFLFLLHLTIKYNCWLDVSYFLLMLFFFLIVDPYIHTYIYIYAIHQYVFCICFFSVVDLNTIFKSFI